MLGGAVTATESRDERLRELLIAEQRQREAERRNRADEWEQQKRVRDEIDEREDKALRMADQAKKTIAEANEQQRREALVPTRIKILRTRKPYSDPATFSDTDLQAIAARDEDFKAAMGGGTSNTTLQPGSPEKLSAIEAEETVRGRVRSRFRAGPQPRQPTPIKSEEEYVLENIDELMTPKKYGQQPMSAEQARAELSRRYRAARGQASASAPTPPPRPTAGAGQPAQPRGIDSDTQQLLNEAAEAYKRELAEAATPAEKAAIRQTYNETVRLIARKRGLTK